MPIWFILFNTWKHYGVSFILSDLKCYHRIYFFFSGESRFCLWSMVLLCLWRWLWNIVILCIFCFPDPSRSSCTASSNVPLPVTNGCGGDFPSSLWSVVTMATALPLHLHAQWSPWGQRLLLPFAYTVSGARLAGPAASKAVSKLITMIDISAALFFLAFI